MLKKFLRYAGGDNLTTNLTQFESESIGGINIALSSLGFLSALTVVKYAEIIPGIPVLGWISALVVGLIFFYSYRYIMINSRSFTGVNGYITTSELLKLIPTRLWWKSLIKKLLNT